MIAQDRIEIPDNEAGRRCYEVFAQVALRQLHRAREATTDFVFNVLPKAEIVDEHAMTDGKYSAILALPGGKRRLATYDYLTKSIELI